MSDPMSNREIEDVLTSIRRLVAQEGDRSGEAPRTGGTRLVLTEAQRVAADQGDGGPQGLTNPASAEGAPQAEAPVLTGATGPMILQPANATAVDTSEVSIPAPDFGKLEATIAELEAAVSATGADFEGGPADESPKPSNVTELYGRLSFTHRKAEVQPQPEPVAEAAPEPAPVADLPDPVIEVDDTPVAVAEATTAIEPVAEVDQAPLVAEPEAAGPVAAPAAMAADPESMIAEEVFEDTVLDEEALRELISQIVREELRGALGERITQQVRKLVRSEIAKALDDRGFL
ncbi:hypothetical protein [Pararhodobacter sp. CCB-MM2]|uniref:hypothetical protein n=1 Tax=Pararhodobacter sp. CCB-MM2 TaxID=1786003 RepID=UPI000830BA95|nr:hypothetical protein [Pararhodobacter sp. CCB-MM2]